MKGMRAYVVFTEWESADGRLPTTHPLPDGSVVAEFYSDAAVSGGDTRWVMPKMARDLVGIIEQWVKERVG